MRWRAHDFRKPCVPSKRQEPLLTPSTAQTRGSAGNMPISQPTNSSSPGVGGQRNRAAPYQLDVDCQLVLTLVELGFWHDYSGLKNARLLTDVLLGRNARGFLGRLLKEAHA